jgi:hypothetical protein
VPHKVSFISQAVGTTSLNNPGLSQCCAPLETPDRLKTPFVWRCKSAVLFVFGSPWQISLPLVKEQERRHKF